jgi:predicted amidohydrolase YtcJ
VTSVPPSAYDVILHGGKVVTLDRASRIVEALGVRAGRIAAVGAAPEILKGRSPGTRVIDISGRTVTPGFCDGHPHMDRSGLRSLGGIPLDGCDSVAQIVEVVSEAAARTPAGRWIVLMPMGTDPLGYVYRPDQLKEGWFPTRYDLDAVAPDHPVYIRAPWAWWSHRPFPSVANTRALALAGVTRATEAPYNVTIVKDVRGEPTGVFLDENRTPLLEYTLMACVPRVSYEDRVTSVRLASAIYSAAGTTAGYEGHGLTPAILDAYRHVHAAGELTVRMQLALSLPTAAFDDGRTADLLYHWAPTLRGRGSGDDMLKFEGVAFDISDPRTAAILARSYPYEQWAGHFPQALSYERFVELGVLAARLGLRVNCCVPYDFERVLRAYEAIDAEVPIRDRRWVVIHVTEASSEQIRRMKALGVVATVNPGFMYMASDRFGLATLGERGTPIRQLLDAGIPVALSTDNVPHSMLFAMQQALTRWDDDSHRRLGPSGLTREDALRMATQARHVLTWEEDDRGTLEVGKVADFVVLGDDPLTCHEEAIARIPVEQTWVSGRRVFPGA